MAGAKDPRSMMIGMMYLVLMALLALNVSSEVLNAFKILNESLEASIKSIADKNKLLFSQFDKEIQAQGEFKVRPYKDKAISIKNLSAETQKSIDAYMKRLKNESDPKPDGSYKEAELNAASRIFIEQGEGKRLKDILQKFRNQFEKILDLEDKKKYMEGLPLKLEVHIESGEDGGHSAPPNADQWSVLHFYGMASVGGITILNKYKNDVVNVEGAAYEYLLKKINAQDIKFDKFEPLITSNSSYLMQGQNFEATIAIGAFSSTSQPKISVNGVPLPVVDGKAIYKTQTREPGRKSLKAVVMMKLPDGREQPFTKEIIYDVGIPSGATATADKVNVLYRGIENPITVSGGGAGQEKIKVNISNATRVTGTGSFYKVTPGDGPNCDVVINIEGNMTKSSFRVKDVPSPIPSVGEFEAGKTVPIVQFKAEGGVRALLKDFLFEGLNFEILNYKIGGNGPGFPEGFMVATNEGGRWNGRAKQIVDQAKPGAIIYIDDIQVKGPDGKTKRLNGVFFKMK